MQSCGSVAEYEYPVFLYRVGVQCGECLIGISVVEQTICNEIPISRVFFSAFFYYRGKSERRDRQCRKRGGSAKPKRIRRESRQQKRRYEHSEEYEKAVDISVHSRNYRRQMLRLYLVRRRGVRHVSRRGICLRKGGTPRCALERYSGRCDRNESVVSTQPSMPISPLSRQR